MASRALGDLAQITVGHVGPMADQYVPEGIPFLRSMNVRPFALDLQDVKFISPEFNARLKKSQLRPGDVVVVRTGAPGTAAVIPQSLRTSNCSDLVIIRPGELLDPRFLAYFINGAAMGFVSSRLVGAVQQHFNVGSAREMPIPPFDLEAQRRIAGVLGALDDLIETNQALIGNLIQASRAIVLRHLSGPLEPLASILDLRRGVGYRSSDFSEATGIPSISMGASSNSGLLKRAKIRLLDRDVPNRYLVEPYDIVMANVDLTWDFGILAWPVVVPEYLGSSVAITSDMYGLRLRTEHADLSIAVWAQLMDDRFRDWVASCAKGTTVASIAQKDVLQFEVRTGVSEAARVAAREMLRLVWSLEEENLSLRQSRNELLPLLMSGRVHVGNVAA